MRRTTARRGERWLVVTLWGSEEQAAAFEAASFDHPIQVEFDGHLETGSVETHRYDTLE
jgi:heme-degrading monooxygenase HmoA